MPDASSPSSSPTAPRPKAARSATIGTVRGRTSPVPGSSSEQNPDARPQKRARKAINCEPCRNSKLKCDRNRPCSSCVLRGTSAMCYQDSRGHDGSDSLRGDEPHYARIDPAQEIARMRHSLNLLEAHVFPNQRPHPIQTRRASDAAALIPKKEPLDSNVAGKSSAAPGMLGSQGQGGLYAGATSAAMHLLANDSSRGSECSDSRPESQERAMEDFPTLSPEYDRDLLGMLPSLDVIDGLIDYYFEYCNWIYRHVNKTTFTQQWQRFKTGSSADRIVLATACVLMTIATHYLPPNHSLLEGSAETHETMGHRFYEVSTMALQRRQAETKTYNLELVELLLVRCHYQTLLKTDSEEIWSARGELIAIGTAMGLHRDPGKWRMHRDVGERRRWAWWHIILLERWQAFMFGRPISMQSHHFDTQLPSYCDPSVDKTGRLYIPNIALFRLAFILGDIMDDAVSVRPVPYENVQANDRALQQWMDTLPPELDLDEYRLARNLASPDIAVRRIGVQSVIIRSSYYHIRFTLHRPYATPSPHSSKASANLDAGKSAQSLEIAVNAADKLITMVGQSRPDFIANSSLAVPAHMNWGPFHCFSAAMFFSFQLIASPDQPGAGLFRTSIRRAITTLEQARGMVVADKAYDILQALAPLYSADFPQLSPEAREKEQSKVLGVVRKLAFPYHDSHDPRRFSDSPSGRGAGSSPANSSSVSPPMMMMSAPLPRPYDNLPTTPTQLTLSSVRTVPAPQLYPLQTSGMPQSSQMHGSMNISLSQSPQSLTPQQNLGYPQSMHLMSGSSYGNQFSMTPQNGYSDHRYGHYVQDDPAMWGASVGFAHSEWSQFLDGLRPDASHSRSAGS